MTTTREDGASKRQRVDQGQAFDRFSAATDLPMTVLTIAWIPVLIVPLVDHVHGTVASSLDLVDYVIWALFALEYLVKLGLAEYHWTYVRTHLLDLLVVAVPFLRPLRAARLLRLIRFGRLGTIATDALKRARAILTHRGLHYVLLCAGILIVVCAGLVTLAENHAKGSNIHDFGQGLWWAIVTVTTVGYGDKYPVTPLGQGVAVLLMIVGIGLIGTLTATVASFFVEESKSTRENEIVERLERIEQVLTELASERTSNGGVWTGTSGAALEQSGVSSSSS